MKFNFPTRPMQALLITTCLLLAACTRPAEQVTLMAGDSSMGGEWTVKVTGAGGNGRQGQDSDARSGEQAEFGHGDITSGD